MPNARESSSCAVNGIVIHLAGKCPPLFDKNDLFSITFSTTKLAQAFINVNVNSSKHSLQVFLILGTFTKISLAQ